MSQMFIYGLSDPETQLIRYVGLTTNGSTRPRVHLRRPADFDHTHRANWIRSLNARGLKPEWFIIEEHSNVDELSEAEGFWIAYLRGLGSPLTNHRSGGLESKHTPESRTKISEKLQGIKRSPETIERMRQCKLGVKNPMFGKSPSLKTRIKRSQSMSGAKNHNFGKPMSEEQKAKISKTMKERGIQPPQSRKGYR